MKQKHFKQEVIGTFQKFAGKSFTVGQALDAYMTMPSRIHSELKSARQFIHRNILRLIATGDLVKMSAGGHKHEYRVTDQFNLRLVESKSTSVIVKIEPMTKKSSIDESLTERLNHQKMQLLTAMGEVEEYDAIYKEMPEIRAQIQALYNESRDRCSKLLGKVKAIENLITLSSR
jgi:hypothetical protein